MTAVQFALCEPTWDPEPEDEDDDGPWCRHPADLAGQGADPYRLATMTTLTVSQEYL